MAVLLAGSPYLSITTTVPRSSPHPKVRSLYEQDSGNNKRWNKELGGQV